MASIYVRSTDGSDSDNGSTWALAKATIFGAAALDAAGDTIYVSQAHAESSSGSFQWNLAGTPGSPTRIIAANDGAEPPTSSSTAAKVTMNGTNSLSIITTAGAVYIQGIQFEFGVGTASVVNPLLTSGSASRIQFKDCAFRQKSTGGGTLKFSNAEGRSVILENCTFFMADEEHSIGGIGMLTINGGSIESGTHASLYFVFNDVTNANISGFDFSNCPAGVYLFVPNAGYSRVKIRNCKLPASWSGGLVDTISLPASGRYEMMNCDSGDTNYRLWIEVYAGTIKSETTVVKIGGASDGTTPISWKFTTTANARAPVNTVDSQEIVGWNGATGSPITVEVDVVTDGVTLNDDEAWLEVQYLGTSGYPLGSFISDTKSDILGSAAAQGSSSATWTTTGLSSPVKQKLSVTFTPQEVGFIHAVVRVAKASTTVYVDPTISGSSGHQYQIPGGAFLNGASGGAYTAGFPSSSRLGGLIQ